MIKNIFLGFSLFFFAVPFCFGATDSTIVRLQVGLDAIAPSTPSGVNAIPVAQTQIDLSWTASTDNFLLSGYQVFRDAVQIATTTVTSYSDSGLTASTSYMYFIRAFDSSYNISSSSASVSTTTFPNTVTPTTTPSQSSTGTDTTLELREFSITSDLHRVEMVWQTSRYARTELRWGRTSSYELGFVANELYKKDHRTVITDLLSGTTYEYELVGFNKDGKKTVLKRGRFKTEASPDSVAPTNVSNLKATIDGDAVLLNWDNPQDIDFSHVRIVRSHLFYPQDPSNGFIAYSDTENSFYDIRALLNNPIQYYSVFSYDKSGNISSGAIISVRKKDAFSGTQATSSDTTSYPRITLQFSDVEFIQDGIEVKAGDIDARVPLLIRIPYSVFPEHLKTITVTFTHPQDTNLTFSFLLRINKNKSYYEALVAPLRIEGLYPVLLTLYDHQTEKVYEVTDSVRVYKKTSVLVIEGEGNRVTSSLFLNVLLFVMASGLLLWILSLFLRKIRRL